MQGTWAQLATTFRKALVACPKDGFPQWERNKLRDFPTQCCEVASFLLAHFLWDKGHRNIRWVFGYLDPPNLKISHLWLESDGWIIDITASQFDDALESVVVAQANGQSWHSNVYEWERDLVQSDSRWAKYGTTYATVKGWLEGAG